MFVKMKSILSFVCVISMSVILIAGCGRKEEMLDLPEDEMRELEVIADEGGEVQDTSLETGAKPAKIEGKKFFIYAEKGYFKNHFIPAGWMGDYGDLRINEAWKENPYSRRTCIRIDYSARRKQGAGWAGVYWQDPLNNWGNVPGGFNLTGAKKLTFYARGETGGELITEFKVGGIQGAFSDSTAVSIGPIALTPHWEKYTISLENEDLSVVIGGFAFVLSEMENPEGAIFYLDEIVYE